MPTSRGSFGLLLLAIFAIAGCGGGVSVIGTQGSKGDGGPGGPGNPGDDLVGDDEISFDGSAPADAGPPIDPRCASGNPIGTGLACSVSGLTCPLGTITDCKGNVQTLECACQGQLWSCDPVPVLDCPPPPPPPSACPDPSTIYPGNECQVPLGQQCTSTEIPGGGCGGDVPPPETGPCTCTTTGWSCQTSLPPCLAPPPESCPSPYDVFANGYCNTPGLTCPGNPQPCGDQTYYDALQCEDGWVSIATTSCDLYPGDDAGVTYDASPAIFVDAGIQN